MRRPSHPTRRHFSAFTCSAAFANSPSSFAAAFAAGTPHRPRLRPTRARHAPREIQRKLIVRGIRRRGRRAFRRHGRGGRSKKGESAHAAEKIKAT